MNKNHEGFTLIELIIVIAIIGILSAVTTVSYGAIHSKSYDASIMSDIEKMYSAEEIYNLETKLTGKKYDSSSGIDSELGFSSSNGNIINVNTDSSGYCIRGYNPKSSKNSIENAYIKESDPGACSRISAYVDLGACPSGFIDVPGSLTYGTSDFCVMKYEAKADDNGDGLGDTNHTTSSGTWDIANYPISATRKLVSTAVGSPVANISQTTALTAATSYTKNCETGCHLITEAEWMTIIQNILSVASNWSNGSVNNGFVYKGHTDNNPTNAIQADTSGDNGYVNTGNLSPSNQRRTLTLTNGEVIWDISGNIYEWTQGTIAGGNQPGIPGESAWDWKEWNDPLLNMNGLSVISRPSTTGIVGSDSWGSDRGIGLLCSNYDETSTRAFMRGGQWTTGGGAGVLNLCLEPTPDDIWTAIGMRVVRDN